MPKQKRRKQSASKATRPPAPAATFTQVDGPLDVADLAQQLTSPDREQPILVLTIAPGATCTEADMDRLMAGMPEKVGVYLIASNADTNSLISQLGSRESAVYGGAARIYPPGNGWATSLDAAPVRLPKQYPDRATFTEQLLMDCRRAMPKLTASPSSPVAAGEALPLLIDEPPLAVRLARHLQDPNRTRTAVVVTRPSGASSTLIDVAELRSQVGTKVDVYELANGPVSHMLAAMLPDRCTVYGGAARTYPPGWTGDLDAAPLRFVWNPADAERVAEIVISDALAASHSTGGTFSTVGLIPASGSIIGVAGGRALVTLAGGGLAAIRPELTVDGVSAERLFATGMTVTGQLDEPAGLLDVTEMMRPADEALAAYLMGDTISALVTAVAATHADVALYPGVTVRLERHHIIDPSRRAGILDLLTVGETVPAILVSTPTEGGWQLDLAAVDLDIEPVPAPALLPGGPAWLIPAVEEVELEPEPEPEPVVVPEPVVIPEPAPVELQPGVQPDAPTPNPVVELPTPASIAALESMTAERDQLLADLAATSRRADRANESSAKARTRIREAETALAQSRRKAGSAGLAVEMIAAEGSLFADPEEQLRFEVDLAWARRIPAGEKAARPLGRYMVGPNFFDTLDNLEGVDRRKIVDVIVEIVTGLVHEMAGRELHQLRTGGGGSDPGRVRADGATAWRVSLQIKTPSARRLHYWMLRDRTIELASVRVHDDFRD